MLKRCGHVVEHHLHLPAQHVGQRLRGTAIWQVNNVDTGHHLEQLSAHMDRRSVARRREIDLARIGLGISDKLRNGLSRNRWIYLHHVRKSDDAGHRRNVAKEIVVELAVQGRVDGIRWRNEQDRVAIWGRADHRLSGILLPAPGRLSTMNDWPSRSESHWPVSRAAMSAEPPGVYPKRTGLCG
jgi:hypothetical protein